MGSGCTQYEGGLTRGGDVPWYDPTLIRIVGDDDNAPATNENWYAQCPRATQPPGDKFVDDVRKNGVREPIDVYLDGKHLVVLEGRRRLHAARIVWQEQAEAGIKREDRTGVRVLIRKGTPEELYAFNIGKDREGGEPKPKSPLERAGQMLLHWNRTGQDYAKTGAVFGVQAQVVRYTLKVFDLHVDLQRKVDRGEITLRDAVELGGLEKAKQPEAAAALEAVGATKGHAAREGIKKIKRGEKPEKPKPRGERNARADMKSRCRAISEKIAVRLLDRKKELEPSSRAIYSGVAAFARFLAGERKALNYLPELVEIIDNASAGAADNAAAASK